MIAEKHHLFGPMLFHCLLDKRKNLLTSPIQDHQDHVNSLYSYQIFCLDRAFSKHNLQMRPLPGNQTKEVSVFFFTDNKYGRRHFPQTLRNNFCFIPNTDNDAGSIIIQHPLIACRKNGSSYFFHQNIWMHMMIFQNKIMKPFCTEQ